MNPTLLLLFIPVILIAAFCRWKFPHTITWGEVAAQLGASLCIVAIVWGISTYSLTADTETMNGEVTGKSKDWVSCSHSYSCNCYTTCSGSGKSRSCSRHCSTCWEHSNDWDWNVASNVGGFTIDRIDRRGSDEPPRWTAVRFGQPVALPHGYTNYVKGAPDSLFHVIADFKGKLPEYPGFYDYQFQDRVIGAPQEAARWNRNLAEVMKAIGPEKQANLLIVMTSHPPRFADALRSKWIGGKKNDVVVVIGTKYPRIDWVRVFSWSKYDIVNIRLRNRLIESGTLDPKQTLLLIRDELRANYVRRPMKDFEYLKDDVHPSTWVMVLAILLGVGVSVGLAIFFHGNDLYDETHRPDRGRRRGPAASSRLRFDRFRQ